MSGGRRREPDEWVGSLGAMLSSLSIRDTAPGPDRRHDHDRSPCGSRGHDSDSTRRTTDMELREAKEKQGAERQKLIEKHLKTAQQVSILYMFDATGSMESKIKFVKDQCVEMFQAVMNEYRGVKIKAGVVAYRDFDCGEDHTDVLDFTGNIDTFKSFLSRIEARGGGDTAEDIFSGIEKAQQLGWKDGTNLILHIADAPCHGSRFHDDGCMDDHPAGDPRNRDLRVLLGALFHKCRVVK